MSPTRLHGSLLPLVSWPFAETARELGLPADLVRGALQDAGGEARMAHATANALLTAAVELSGRPDFGLLAAQRVEPGHFDVIELASRSQRTVVEALETMAALVPVLHDGLRLTLEVRGDNSRLVISLRDGLELHPAGFDFMAASLLIAGRRQTGVSGSLLHGLELPYPRPEDPSYLERFFQVELSFDAPALALRFPSTRLATALLRGDAQVGKLMRAAAEELLPSATRKQGELELRARELVRVGLAHGRAELSAVAHELHVSGRTLRRKLAHAGVQFRELVDEERHARALELLDDPRLSTEALAEALGFTTAQAFHRAFRRWTGTTLQVYRARRAR